MPAETAVATVTATMISSGGTVIPVFLIMFIIVLLINILFWMLQIVFSANRKTYIGLAGAGIDFVVALMMLIMVITAEIAAANAHGYLPPSIFMGFLMFLCFNLPTALQILVTVLTNYKHIGRNAGIDKMNIEDL
ncbi:MAG: hypothetical protein FWF49_03730 [Oscillospiraceae bacterium]|nr:hypothetical protein [Oscillospiraceae bacterium]